MYIFNCVANFQHAYHINFRVPNIQLLQLIIMSTRAGHGTSLPRQLDHVFKAQSCWLLQFYCVRCGYSIKTPSPYYFSDLFLSLNFYCVVAFRYREAKKMSRAQLWWVLTWCLARAVCRSAMTASTSCTGESSCSPSSSKEQPLEIVISYDDNNISLLTACYRVISLLYKL